MSIVEFNPATIVEIKVGDCSAPVAVGVELSKLYLSADAIVRELIKDVYRDEESQKLMIPPDLLNWYKEQRMLLSEIHKLTGEVEQKTNIRRMELQAEIFKQLIKDMPQEQKISFYKKVKAIDRNGNTE